MFHTQKLFLLYYFSYFPIECVIPALEVQKVDRELIERQRQDTVDMCKMFAEENNRLDFQFQNDGSVNQNILQNSKRIKRDLHPSNLNLAEARRVENIVDKLYDDLAEQGERVTYRQRNLSTIQPPVTPLNGTARRFYFAPALLVNAVTDEPKKVVQEDTSYQIPWIKFWKHGIIPYFIDPNTYDSHLQSIIIRAFDIFEKATCIRLQRLREKPTDLNSLNNVEWLYITNPSGIYQCVHSNEKKPNIGVQMIVFGYDCLALGEILHEVMHILGFSHEHTRPDRDQYITVLWDNIKPGYKKYFEARTFDPLAGFPYDYGSILHYPSRAFSKNGQLTLLVESGIKVGQRDALSDTDVAKITAIFSPECTKRNKDYLLKTCPSVVKLIKEKTVNISKTDIQDYFKDRLWPYGVVTYKIRDRMEFTSEERENLNAVFSHIQKETCIQFHDVSDFDAGVEENNNNDSDVPHLLMKLEKVNIESIRNTSDFEETDDAADNKLESNEDTSKDNNTKNSEENLVIGRKHIGSNTGINTKRNSGKLGTSKSTYEFGNLYKASNKFKKKVNGTKASSARRHAESTLTLVRSLDPGCTCPPPGKTKGDTILKINADCFNSVNDLLHLFVHILGLDHQHNMHDRDSYLRILWENLTPGMTSEINNKLPPAASVGFPYDYQSVMHYPWLKIESGVTNIMYPIWNDGWAMGHWQGLSSTDVNKLNLIYYEQCALRKQEEN